MIFVQTNTITRLRLPENEQENVKVIEYNSIHDDMFQHSSSYNDDLQYGILECDLTLVNEAISYGADVNHVDDYTKETPLFLALTSTLEIFDFLVQHGADVHARNKSDNTLLHKACEYEYADIVSYLLDKKINVNAVDNIGKTPLLNALYAYMTDKKKLENIVEKLIQNGANVNVQDDYEHNTALHLACDQNAIEIVKILVKGGADLQVRNYEKQTAYDIAMKHGYDTIACFLREN